LHVDARVAAMAQTQTPLAGWRGDLTHAGDWGAR
jgi:hypothetical protein